MNKNKQTSEQKENIFRECSDWQNNALLYGCGSRWETYTAGYRMAAESLVQRVIEEGTQDLLIYPIVFLYRHYIELRLKELLLSGNRLLKRPVKVEKEHNIQRLWCKCREIIKAVWPDEDKLFLEVIEDRIGQFCSVDPKSMAFRYPEDLKGNETLQGLQVINVRHVSKIMEELGNSLDGVSIGINEYQGLQWNGQPKTDTSLCCQGSGFKLGRRHIA